jgi:hypothetical protein
LAILVSPAVLRMFLLGAAAIVGTCYALVRHYDRQREREAAWRARAVELTDAAVPNELPAPELEPAP